MNCIAIWYKHKTHLPKELLNIDLHINLWQLKKKRLSRINSDQDIHDWIKHPINTIFQSNNKRNKAPQFKNFLDIGIKLYKPSNVSRLYIYLPFQITNNDFEDLGKLFEGNNNIVAAIFNEEFKAQPIQPQGKILEVVDGSGEKQFFIYMIDKATDFNIRNKFNGSIVEIKVNKSANSHKPLYYRFRITSDELEQLYTQYQPESQWIDNHATMTDLIDFRVNEKRNLDRTLLEDMRNYGELFFKKVDYFVMREFKYDYISSHREMLRSRRLEEDLWNVYVGEDCECDKIIAYHWSWEDKPGFNAFVKYKFLTSDRKKKFTFCLFLLFIGLLGGALGTLIITLISLWCSWPSDYS